AQNNLGILYSNGRGVPQDQVRADLLFHSAAEQGLTEAQFNLGRSYRYGQGVEIDDVIAYVLFSLAASSEPDAANAIRDLDGTLNPAQLREARELISSWKPGGHLPVQSRTWLAPRDSVPR